MATNKIVDVYRQIINKYSSKGEYGGKGKFHLPVDHKAALVLKEGAFSCEHCQYVNAEKHDVAIKLY